MAAPALPIPDNTYSAPYMQRMLSVLRLYFDSQVDVAIQKVNNSGELVVSSSAATAIEAASTGGAYFVDTTAGNVTVTLPAASTVVGRSFIVKRKTGGTNTLTVQTVSGNIDGGATASIPTQYTSLTFKSDGTDYWVI